MNNTYSKNIYTFFFMLCKLKSKEIQILFQKYTADEIQNIINDIKRNNNEQIHSEL